MCVSVCVWWSFCLYRFTWWDEASDDIKNHQFLLNERLQCIAPIFISESFDLFLMRVHTQLCNYHEPNRKTWNTTICEFEQQILLWTSASDHRVAEDCSTSAVGTQRPKCLKWNEQRRSISTVIIDELCANNRVKHDVNRFAFTFTHIQYFGPFSHGIARNSNVLIDGSSGFIKQKIGMSCGWNRFVCDGLQRNK